MANFFEDIAGNFHNAINDIDIDKLRGIIPLLEEIQAHAKETGDALNTMWKDGVAPSSKDIETIDKLKASLSGVFHAQEQLTNVMHSAWGNNGDKNIRSKIELYEVLQQKMREVYSTTQSAEENGDKVLAGRGGSGTDKSLRDFDKKIAKEKEQAEALKALRAQVNFNGGVGKMFMKPVSGDGTGGIGAFSNLQKVDLSVKQKREQLESLGETAVETGKKLEEAKTMLVKVFDKKTGKFVEKEMPVRKPDEQKLIDDKILEDAKKKTEEKIAKANEQVRKSTSSIPVFNNVDKSSALDEKIKKTEEELKHLQETAEQTGTMMVKIWDSSSGKYVEKAVPVRSKTVQKEIDDKILELDALKREKRQLEEDNANAQTKASETSSAPAQATALGLALRQTFIQMTGFVAKNVANITKLLGTGLVNGFKLAISGAKQLVSAIGNLISSGFNALKSAVSTTLGNMKSLITNGFHAVAKSVSVVKSAFDSVRSKMNYLTKKATPNLLKSFSSIKSMLMRRIKRTFISSIFNQAKQGIQGLAKYSDSFNQAMSTIKNSAKESAGNLAVTLGNLVEMIAPALQTLLGWFNQLLQAINAVFALLNGKKTVTVAQKSTDNYAKSLKKAGGAAKDLNHQLYGFDEITRQEDNNGGGGDSGNKYEEQLVESGLADFFQKLIDAFKAGKFEEVGKMLADALNGIIEKVNDFIVKLRKKATKWASNITRIFNGMLSKKLFQNLGKLIGNGVNLLFDVVNTIFKTLDFKQLGTVVAEAINAIFDTIEWNLVGETFANYFNGIWEYLGTLFGKLNWANIGKKLADGLTSFFKTIKWDKYTTMLANGINGVFTMLYSLVSNVNWGEIASNLNANMVDLVKNKIKWDIIENALSESINALLDVFHVIANSDFFIELAEKLGKTVGGILNKIDWEQLAKDIGVGLAKLRTAFWKLIKKIDIPNLAIKLAGAINSLLTDPNVKKAWDDSEKEAIDGINQVIDAFSNFVADPPVGIDFKGIAGELGKRIRTIILNIDFLKVAKTVKNGILRVAESFASFTKELGLSDIALKLSEGINSFFDPNAEVNFGTIASRVSEGVNEIIHGFDTLLNGENGEGGINFESISSSLAEGIKSLLLKTEWETLITDLGELITKVTTEFFRLVTEVFEPSVNEAGEQQKTLGQKLADGINGIFKDDKGKLDTSMFEGLGQSLGEAIKNLFNDINRFITETDWDDIGKSIGTALANVDWVGIANSILTLLWNALLGAVKLAGGLFGTVINKIFGIEIRDDTFNGAGSAWASSAYEGFKEEMRSGEPSAREALLKSAVAVAGGWSQEFSSEFDKESAVAHGKLTGFINALVTDSQDGGEKISAFASLIGYLPTEVVTAFSEGKELVGKNADEFIQSIYKANSIDEIRALFGEAGKSIPEEFIQSLLDMKEPIGMTGKSLLYAVQDAKTAQETIDAFGAYGIQISEEFASKIGGMGVENIAAAMQLMGMGIDDSAIAMLDTLHLSENLDSFMRESGATIEQASLALLAMSGQDITALAQTLGVDVGDVMALTIPEGMAKGMKEGEKTVQSAVESLKESGKVSGKQKEEVEEAGQQAGKAGTEGMQNATNEGKEGVEQATDNVLSPVKEKYEALPDEVKPYAEKLMEYIVTALSDKDGTVKSAIEAVAQSAVDRAREILAGDVGIEIGETFINGINQGIVNTYSPVVANVSEVCGMMLDSATNHLNYQNGVTIGENMIIGIYNGFYSYSQKLVDFIAHVCNVSAQTARQILGISSPSKVFAEIGAYTMEGMQVGLEKTGADAIATVSDLTNAIVNEAENGDGINMQVNAMTDGLDAVESKMSRIAEIFSGIADTIANMGGLQIPTVASGQVIPYKTKVDTSDVYSTGSALSASGIEDALYSAFTRAMSNDNNQQPIEVKLVVDGRTLADIVTKKQREQQRAWGV